MKNDRLPILIPGGVFLIGVLVIFMWMGSEGEDIKIRVPGKELIMVGMDNGDAGSNRNPGTLILGTGQPLGEKGSWPQFRGPERTGIALKEKGLMRKWPGGGPRILWKKKLGEGYAGATVYDGRVYLIDYDQEKKEDAIRCLSLADGEEIWRYSYYVKVKRSHGMSRTVPAVTGKYIVTIGPLCYVTCLDSQTGEVIWRKNLVKEFGTRVPPWYAGQCPLIDGDVVIIAPGGEVLMMAVELETGDIRWVTPNSSRWRMTHSSVTSIDFQGNRQYIYCASEGVVGVSAKDGKILWKKPEWKINIANVPTPVIIGQDRIFFSGGYNAGSLMVRLKEEESEISTEELFRLKPTVFGAQIQTPILYDNYIYGIIPNGELVCLALNGEQLWRSGRERKFGRGPFLVADGLIYVLNDHDGTLYLVEAVPSEYRELSSAKILSGHDSWGPMAMVNGRLILRDLREMVCIDVKGLAAR